MNNPLPVDQAMATLDHRRRFVWDDAFARHRELTEEEQALRDRRRKPQKQH
jgi:hypothetical protein